MVAYTDPDCLPYFEGSDAPCLDTGSVCDPSTVWCDFAELVEAKLTEYDQLVRRTASSVPMAWVETIVPTEQVIGTSIQPAFTTVRNDTDNMVDLDVLSNGFRINTSGLYTLWAYAYGTHNSANSSTSSPTLTVSTLPATTPATALFVSAGGGALTASLSVSMHSQLVTPLGAGQSLSLSIGGGGTTGNRILYSKIAMGAAWVGDLP